MFVDQAGDTVYKVHRHFFERESLKFRETLNAPAPPGQSRPGATIGTAIELDVETEALDKFLWVFYNP